MASEQQGFVFAVMFLLIFTAVYASMPAALQGAGATPDTISEIDPSLITDFAETLNWTRTGFTEFVGTTKYYTLGGYDWVAVTDGTNFAISRKIKLLGMLWLGATKTTNFYAQNGTKIGDSVSLTNIAADQEDGAVRYNLKFQDDSSDAGGFVFWYNTTTYATPALAWTADKLNLMHGVGLGSSATGNILSVLVSLLTFSIPDVPPLISVLLGSAPWASIIFILWFIIKETIPFV